MDQNRNKIRRKREDHRIAFYDRQSRIRYLNGLPRLRVSERVLVMVTRRRRSIHTAVEDKPGRCRRHRRRRQCRRRPRRPRRRLRRQPRACRTHRSLSARDLDSYGKPVRGKIEVDRESECSVPSPGPQSLPDAEFALRDSIHIAVRKMCARA